MITVIGPNPAIDLILKVSGLAPGTVHRSQSAVHMAGGKPVIVARILRRIGIGVTLLAPLGGRLREPILITEACRDLGIDLRQVPIVAATRTCVTVVDSESGTSTVINEPGPHMSSDETGAYEQVAFESLREGRLVIGSGSLPPGLPSDLYGRLAAQARKLGTRFIVDASGEALRQALLERPWAVKVNCDELMAVVADDDVVVAAEHLLASGIDHMVVTLGADGAIYLGREGRLHASTLPVNVVNPIGSGDAFLAGLAGALDVGKHWTEAMRVASAVAGLATNNFQSDIDQNPDLEPLLELVELRPL